MSTSLDASIVLLAAGESKRMGSPKPAQDLNGQPLIHYALTTLSSLFDEIVVVEGAYPLAAHTAHYPKVKLIRNNDYKLGMGSSLQKALPYCNHQFIFIQLADTPFIPKSIFYSLFKLKRLDGIVLPVFHNKTGHPTLISQNVAKLFLKNKKPPQPREIFFSLPSTRLHLKNPAPVIDIDTAEQLQIANQYLKNQIQSQKLESDNLQLTIPQLEEIYKLIEQSRTN